MNKAGVFAPIGEVYIHFRPRFHIQLLQLKIHRLSVRHFEPTELRLSNPSGFETLNVPAIRYLLMSLDLGSIKTVSYINSLLQDILKKGVSSKIFSWKISEKSTAMCPVVAALEAKQ